MNIRVKVQLNMKQESVFPLSDGRFQVAVSADRKHGEANIRIAKLLAEYFAIPSSSVVLVSGHTQSTKVFRVYGA